MNDHNHVISEAVSKLSDQDQLNFALKTPDLYPAKNVAVALGVPVAQVHAWRRERGIRKASS